MVGKMLVELSIYLQSYTVHLEGGLIELAFCEISISRTCKLEIYVRPDFTDLVTVVLDRIPPVDYPLYYGRYFIFGYKRLRILSIGKHGQKYGK